MGTNSAKEQLFDEASACSTRVIARIALQYESDPILRRELVQEIFLALWVALDAYRGAASLKTFATAVAMKRCVTHVTRRAREPRQVELPIDLVSGGALPDEIALRNDQKRRLDACIQLLPVPQREAIMLCFEGFSYGEMAEILGISPNAVMLRCQRAKGRLRAIMDRRSRP
jgi:RNA polymerase sigma-70 factor (ECF subfamily)